MEDSEILALFQKRNERAIEEAAYAHGGLCRCLALHILGDWQDAEECLSDTLLAAWNTIPPQQPERLASYLARITRNLALKRLRDRQRLKRGGGQAELVFEELDECIPSGNSVEEQIEQKELAKVLERFLRGLPETERRLFLCRYWYFESVKELSLRFGCRESKVKSMLFRTRKKLKNYLNKEGFCFDK